MLPVRLTATAKRDIARALRKSKLDFGERQARRYAEIIQRGLERVATFPWLGRLRLRTAEIRFLHLRQPGRRAAHFLAYEVHPDRVDVLRLMHEHEDETKALRKFL